MKSVFCHLLFASRAEDDVGLLGVAEQVAFNVAVAAVAGNYFLGEEGRRDGHGEGY